MNKQRRQVPRTGGHGVAMAADRIMEAQKKRENLGDKPPMARLTYGEANSFLRGAAKPDATRARKGGDPSRTAVAKHEKADRDAPGMARTLNRMDIGDGTSLYSRGRREAQKADSSAQAAKVGVFKRGMGR